ncbi:MAG: ketose-bisphosphate aldolase [Clostridia bacterium]|nr:ketose-bisphosphate aldolase [Clostridia bacterium]
MGLQNSKQLFKHAIENNYAIGAFNFVNLETLSAILDAATELNSPVIVQCSTGAIKYAGIKEIAAMVQAKADNLQVILNLDHGKTFEDCKNAIDNGFTNVMIDASSLPFEENIALTKQVVEYAHSKNVTVEAELGVLAGVEDEVSASSDDAKYTNPQQAKEFVERTGVDSLAIAIGTSHGTHKFAGEAKLRFDILEQIEALLPGFPLVLHGASSIPQDMVKLAEQYGAKLKGANGIPEEMLQVATTKHNVVKVNVDSDLRIAFTAGIREILNTKPETVDLRDYLKQGKKYVTEVVKNKMISVFNSAHKA